MCVAQICVVAALYSIYIYSSWVGGSWLPLDEGAGRRRASHDHIREVACVKAEITWGRVSVRCR